MASAAKSAQFVTIEGAEPLSMLAQKEVSSLGFNKVSFIHCNFDAYFNGLRSEDKQAELIYLDGNHQYANTLDYFKKVWLSYPAVKAVILDDINWSSGMRRAWEEIKAQPGCHSIDLYKIGIIFKNTDLTKPIHIKCVPRILKPLNFGFFG